MLEKLEGKKRKNGVGVGGTTPPCPLNRGVEGLPGLEHD